MDTKELKRKTFEGFAQLLVAMALMFFLSAWTVFYWEAWVFLLVFFGTVAFITLYFIKRSPDLIESRLKVGPVAENETSQKIIQAFASLFFIAIILFPGFDHRFHWSDVSIYLILVGDIFVFIGLMIVFFVFKENSHTSAVIEVKDEQKVITTGPYKFMRHPMYSGALLMLFFVPIALGSYWGIIFFFPMLFIIILRLLDEEKFLSKNLAGYSDYMLKTRYRLVPFIW